MIITNFNKLGFSGSVDIITEYVPPSQTEFTTPGTYTWIAPRNVNNVCAVCVGGGGGGKGQTFSQGNGGAGGGLGWKNNMRIFPGQSYTIVVGSAGASTNAATSAGSGGSSYFIDTGTVAGFGGQGALNSNDYSGGGGYVGDGGGNGGGNGYSGSASGGGGGAGGYSGNGGKGGDFIGDVYNGEAGSGGGGGGAGGGTFYAGPGGGVGIYGQGSSGGGGDYGKYANGYTGQPGGDGSGGGYGRGAGGADYPTPYQTAGESTGGAVRIIWQGTSYGTRAFPATNAGNL